MDTFWETIFIYIFFYNFSPSSSFLLIFIYKKIKKYKFTKFLKEGIVASLFVFSEIK